MPAAITYARRLHNALDDVQQAGTFTDTDAHVLRIIADDIECDPAAEYLLYLEAKAHDEPHNAAFLGRVAGNVRKVEGLT